MAAFAAVIASHALAYGLIMLLPDAATRMAALMGGHEPMVESLRARLGSTTYLEALTGLLTGNWGTTVDGETVRESFVAQIKTTASGFVAGAVLIAAVTWAVLSLRQPRSESTPILDFFCFLPPYVYALVGLILVLETGLPVTAAEGWAVWWSVVSAAVAAPLCLMAAQATKLLHGQLVSPQALFARSMGLSDTEVRRLLRRDIIVALAPSAERTAIWLFVSLLFAEIVFGVQGFGSAFAAALRRSDLNMLLIQITFVAAIGNLFRIASDSFLLISGAKED